MFLQEQRRSAATFTRHTGSPLSRASGSRHIHLLRADVELDDGLDETADLHQSPNRPQVAMMCSILRFSLAASGYEF